MSSFVLKLIAIITMLIDHIGALFLTGNPTLYWISRGIGRLAFPIFVFLIVEGFYHTRNLKKYLFRLGIFAFISEIPFDIAFYHVFYNRRSFVEDFKSVTTYAANSDPMTPGLIRELISRLMNHQNVFFTLFLGLLLITLINKLELKFKKDSIIGNALQALLAITFCIIAFLLKTDYSYSGIMLIAAFYLFRENYLLKTLALLLITGFVMGSISIIASLSMLLIALYNGEKGKDIKYLFYIFYPAHLFLLFCLDYFII